MFPSTTPSRAYIVVADRQQASVFFHARPGAVLEESGVADIEIDSSSDPNSDRPGRVHERMGSARHAMEPTSSYQDKGRIALAREVADMLDRELDGGAYDRLVLVASPETLGELRKELSERVAQVVVAELDKSLVGHKIPDLAARLTALEVLGRVNAQ